MATAEIFEVTFLDHKRCTSLLCLSRPWATRRVYPEADAFLHSMNGVVVKSENLHPPVLTNGIYHLLGLFSLV